MECNKDGALRNKELAETVLLKKDFGRAKVYAKKAQELCPNLDGLSQLLATIEVYISAEKRVNEELDWYGILGVQPLANEETIRRRYRKLALTLHPDKNKSVGADGAFNYISQAWSLLSDQAKRIAYDKKCNLWGIPASQNGLSNSVFTPVLLRPTFWTICRSCKTYFEFHNVHLNSKLECTFCHKPFLASATSPPPGHNNVSSTSRIPHNFNSTQMDRRYHVSDRTPMSAVNSSFGSGPFSMPDSISHVPTSASSAAEGLGVFRMSSEDLKRMQGDSTAVLREVSYFGKTHVVERTVTGRTPKSAVNSSLGSGPFSIPVGISRVPTSPSSAAEGPGVFRISSEDLKRMQEDSTAVLREVAHFGKTHAVERTVLGRTPMSAVNSSLGSGPFSMPDGISRGPTSVSSAAEGPGVFRISSEDLKRMQEDSTAVLKEVAHFGKTHAVERTVLGRTPMSAVNSSLGSGPFSMPDGISRVPTSASSAAKGSGVFRMTSEDLKRMQEDSTAVLKEVAYFGKTVAVERTGSFASNSILKEHNPRKKKPTDEHKVGCDRSDMETKTATQNGGINLANESGSQKYIFYSGRGNIAGNYKRNGARDVSQLQMKNMLAEKARKEILKKLEEWKISDASKKLVKSKNTTDTKIIEKGKERVVSSVKPGAQEFVDSETVGKKCFTADPEPELPSLAMNVPDPDFHDFDGDRIENAFGENQVWAVYDNDDGMPRYFCLINDVISKNPFNMRISWLDAKGNDELAPIKWVGSGFLKTSGDFRIGKRVPYSTLNSFSHRVKCTKGSRGVIHIYPKKGDIWALYRNWSLDWNEFTKDEIIQKYDMVEVLEDYNEEQGVNVSPLVKVAGFKTVFRQNADPTKVKNISKAEMFRFSHQVPSYLLTGEEGHNAPKGCLELDPAATPMELLQVLTEDLEQELVMTTKKSVGDELKQKENSKEDGSVERGQTTTKEEGSEGGLGEKRRKPEILFVYKRRRLGQKKEMESGK